jgi:hypothetical protein
MPDQTPSVEALAIASFTVKGTDPIKVHFNPTSLQYTVSNNLEAQGSGARKKQYVSQTTAKLTMDLVFDTTNTGGTVQVTTAKVAKLLQPHGPSGKRVPPTVEFSWGAYHFTGMVEQYKETLDFFSSNGVPLRASINLTLANQDFTFESPRNGSADVGGDLPLQPVAVPASPGPGGGPAGVANALGDPRAARAIAEANGAASLRFSSGVELAVGGGAGVSLAGAAAFSAGASAGAGAGLSAGARIGASAGADFSELRTNVTTPSMLDPSAALSLGTGATAGTGVQFGLGGRAQSSGSASLSADVGANAELTARLGFGG